jgi:tetratricopeptide (TPR) repeat protein
LKCYNNVIKLDPKNEDALILKGDILETLGKYEESLICYDQALTFSKNNSSLWNNKGYVLRKLKRHSDALKCYEQALDLSPDDKDIKENLEQLTYDFYKPCKELFRQEKYEETIKLCTSLLNYNIKNEELLRLNAYSYNKTGHFEKAISCFNKLFYLNKINEKDWVEKAHALDEIGYYPPAIICLVEALKLNEYNRDALFEKNVIKGKILEARKHRKTKKKLGSDDACNLIKKAFYLCITGDYSEGIKLYRKALEKNPTDNEIKKRLDDAVEDLNHRNKILNIEENDLTIIQSKIKENIRQKVPKDKKIKLTSKVEHSESISIIKSDKNDEFTLILKGASFLELKKYKEATGCLDEAISINPKNPIAWFNKGLVFEAMKKDKKALLCYDKALKIDPCYTEAKHHMDDIFKKI